ncbi:universal stress protein [Porticoccaceae bacterium]|jgi:universal stress protein E|nr:universal stress protein [Porticoccaceae bacterium]
MRNMLVVLDGSSSDEQALGQAIQLATSSGGDIHLFMTVYDSIEELNRYIGFDNYQEVKQSILDEAEVKLRQLTDKFGGHFSSTMHWGRRWHFSVVVEAKKISADLIIKAVHRHSRIAEFLHTPEDWHLLRDANCPVWLVNDSTASIDRVVAAFSTLEETEDHRLLGERVLQKADDLAAALGVELHVVSVVPDWLNSQALIGPMPGMPGQFPAVLANIGKQALERAEEIINETLTRLSIVADITEVRSGAVDIELADAVGETGAMVIGSAAARQLGAKVADKLFGNTSEKVIHHAHGDLLVVH